MNAKAGADEDQVHRQADTLASQLVTAPMLDGNPQALRVLWIRWWSGFRGSGLKIGDRIVAVNGQRIERPADLQATQKLLPRMVGQIGEAQVWKEQGLAEDAPLQLRVSRHADAAGWQEQPIRGTLRSAHSYQNAAGRHLIGPGGPDTMASDGLGETWSYWLEKWERWAESLLDDDWNRPGWATDGAHNEWEAHAPRLKFLAERYPGPFSDAIAEDARLIRSLLDGRRYEITPADLAFRRLDEERAEQVAAAGRAAHAEFLERIADEQIGELPQPQALADGYKTLPGKVLVLPAIQPREWVSEAAHNWFATRVGSTWCFVDTEGEAAQRMQIAARRYQTRITPNLPGDYAIIGRIKPDLRLVIAQDQAVTGVELEPLAAMAGERMFVDLTQHENGCSLFAGEIEAARSTLQSPVADASPQAVLDTFFAALKAGDQDLWLRLFADWRALEGGKPLFYPYAPRVSSNVWEDARRRILKDVVDVRITWQDDARDVIRGDEYPGLRRVEETALEVEHIRPVGEAFHSHRARGLTRVWRLQRVHGAKGPGPWRIVTENGL